MNDEAINNLVKKYVRENLSPNEDERAYVSGKYDVLKEILGRSCFRAGSFARYTAVRPLHDLDVVWITDDPEVMDHPEIVLGRLAAYLKSEYQKREGVRPTITIQTHCVTLSFNDTVEGDAFSIDIVPAIHSFDPVLKNDDEEPILIVPEIIKMNHTTRVAFYARPRSEAEDVGWIYTDPRGYISAAKHLDEETGGDYRKTVKLVKAWRSGQKRSLGDEWKFKSFNAEQVCAEEYGEDSDMSALEAIRAVFSAMPNYVANAPLIEDRAYVQLEEDKYIDEYLADPDKVGDEDKKLILNRVMEADRLIGRLPACTNEAEVMAILRQLTGHGEETVNIPLPQPVTRTAPARPYART